MNIRKSPPATESGPAIILSDLRTEPLLAAVHLALSSKGARLLVSQASVQQGDFGDRIQGSSRLRRLALVRLAGRITVVDSPEVSSSHELCKGCRSSLVSYLQQEDANPVEHPELWSRLNRLCEGGSAVAEVLSSRPSRIYLFNGRLASVRKIGQLAYQQGFEVSVYEWAPTRGAFRLFSYPMHDPNRISAEVAQFARDTGFRFSPERAQFFWKRKLNNPFSKGRNEQPVKQYRTVVFAGSPYEYRWAFDHTDFLDSDLETLLAQATAHPEFHRPAALRLHPRAGEFGPDEEKDLKAREIASRFDVEIIGERSLISTRSLIEAAETVMVGATTVSLDAFLLGKLPVFLGPNSYRGLIDAVMENHGTGHEARMVAAGVAAEYHASRIVELSPGVRWLGELWRRLDTLSARLKNRVQQTEPAQSARNNSDQAVGGRGPLGLRRASKQL